jgi:hypothetical protein
VLQLLAAKYQVILTSLAGILHMLYNEDIISEQVFFNWHMDFVKTCTDDAIKEKVGML